MKYRLGLDLGTNSIGFAILELNQENSPQKIIDTGSRIFSDGRDPKTGEPLAVARRVARGMRKRRDRNLSRKKQLMNFLIQINLMPQDEISRKKLELLNPYEIRAKALYEQLKPEELARAIFHLAQRRGFKSNRKEIQKESEITNENEDEKKSKKENAKITDQDKRENLQSEIQKNNCQTLGEYLFKYRLQNGLNARALADYDVLYPTREMYRDEFLAIKNFQQNFQNISEDNWAKIEDIIFFQRKLKPQDKGVCRFLDIRKINDGKLPNWAQEILANYLKINPLSKGLPRAYLALPSYCKFRILSEVNNLKLKNIHTREIIELTPEQKQKIIEKLNSQKSDVKFSKLRKEINTKEISFVNDFEFNLESERRLDIQANPTRNLLCDEKYFGKNWHQFSLTKQDEIVEFLLDEDDELNIENKAQHEWQVSQEQAKNLSKLTINHFKTTAVGSMCKEILQKLCETIEQNNCRYDQALKILEIKHSDEAYGNGDQDFLPYYAKAIPTSVVAVKSKTASQEEQEFGKIANPTVHSALNQIRKVVNSIIKDYGKPAEIHVELARELKQTKEQNDKLQKQQNANKKENDEAKKVLAENNQVDNYENRLRYKLWKELDLKDINNRKCPYTDKTICIKKLFSPEFEIEHILPFSKTLDDSIANKTIASKSANAFKGNRSPFEAFSGPQSPYNYQEILERTKTMPRHKRWRFEAGAMEKFNDQNGFIASQLNDTRYISKIAKQYLQQICDKEKIRIGNGKITALLRHNWGLNSILHKPKNSTEEHDQNIKNFDPETGEVFENNFSEKSDSNSTKKNRDDHRHHAIDAVCIAMTDRKMLQQISRDNARNFDINRLEIKLPSHWNSFREDVKEAVEKIIVSHKIDHGKNVKLHDETNYGKLKQMTLVDQGKKKLAECNLVIKTKIITLKKSDVHFIRDKKIKDLLLLEANKASTDKEFQEKILPEFSKNTGIKRVRLYDNNKSVLEINHPQNKPRFKKIIKTNGNHHISLWKMPNGEYLTDVVSNFKINCPYEIAKSQDGFQYINYEKKFEENQSMEKLKPHPSAKLIIRLFKDDLVRIEEDDKIKTVVVKVIGSTSQCFFLPHNIASSKSKDKNEKQENGKEESKGSFVLNFKTLKSKKLRKIFVTPSGKVFDSGPIFKENN
ncbi:MAG: type II CRISPR RNA-guided endonuclease Cas9 [Proteobacteria bacterium]|nr:type II CRISPR RNA-guided endonuclease Cas9 [Pseudomonadota bacterium]